MSNLKIFTDNIEPEALNQIRMRDWVYCGFG